MYQCPYCKFTNTDLNRLRMHVMTQHSVQPMLRCPLCQDMLNNKIHLQFHLTHLHSVAPDCVDKLIATVSPVLCCIVFSASNGFGSFSLPTCIFQGNLMLACVLLDWYVLAWLIHILYSGHTALLQIECISTCNVMHYPKFIYVREFQWRKVQKIN